MIAVNHIGEELGINPCILKAILIEQKENIPFEMIGRAIAVNEENAERLKEHYLRVHGPFVRKSPRKSAGAA